MSENKTMVEDMDYKEDDVKEGFLAEALGKIPWVGPELKKLLLDTEKQSEEKHIRVYFAERLVRVRQGIQKNQKKALGKGDLSFMTAFDEVLSSCERIEDKLRHGIYGIVGLLQKTTTTSALGESLDFLQVIESQILALEELVASNADGDWDNYLTQIEQQLSSLNEAVRHRELLVKGEGK